jgi:hypothetical protein
VFALLLGAAIAAQRRPKTVVLTALAAVGLAALGLARLELRTDGQALVPRRDPVVTFDVHLRSEFGLRDLLIVYLETTHPDGIYNTGTLARLRDLGLALARLPEITRDHVTSLATEARPRVYPGTLRFRPLLDPFPDTPERMLDLCEDVDAIDLLQGTLVSPDRRGTSILLGVPPVPSDAERWDRAGLYRRVKAIAERFESPTDRIVVVGAPAAEALLGEHILEDLRLLVPLAMLTVALVLWGACRRIAGAAIALTEVGTCLLFTFGVMGWSGVPIYLTTAVLPIILAPIAIADELHLMLCYQRELAREERGALERTLEQMVRPITLTSLTTGLGFLSFASSGIAPVERFGSFAAVGVVFCWLSSVLVVPALLALLGPRAMRRDFPVPRERTCRLLEVGLDRPRPTLLALGLATAALAAGSGRLEVQDSWTSGFAPATPFRRATERVDEKLAGTHVLLAHVEFAARPRGLARALVDGDVLEALRVFEARLREEPGVGGVLGPYAHLHTMHRLFLPGQRRAERLPSTEGQLEGLIDLFDRVRGEATRREVIHHDRGQAIVTLLLRGANYRDTDRILGRARALERELLAPLGATVRFGGDVAVSQAMIPAIVSTQLRSLGLALAGAFGVLLVFQGLRTAALAIVPTAIALLWLLGALGWLGIPIGVATSTFCAITLGIGVDYAVHLLERLRRAPAGPTVPGLRDALATTRPAIIADTLAVALGFGLLAFSRVPANGRLGLIVATALLSSAFLTLNGLPAVLRVLRTREGEVEGGAPPPALYADAPE